MINCRVLLYDDGTSPVDLVAMMPARRPYRVAVGFGQLEQQLDAFSPDVCLMNFACEGISIEDVGQVRERHRWRSVPLVGIGIETPETTRIHAFRQGIDDFLDDLSSVEELNWKILRWTQFYRSSKLSGAVTELLEVMLDREDSPFVSVMRATERLRSVPAFEEDEELVDHLEQAQWRAEDMVARIDLLRDYLRCRSGEEAMRPVACSVGAAVLPQLDSWREDLVAPDATLEIAEGDLDWQVMVDFQAFKRVLLWVGSNACRRARSLVSLAINGEMESGMVHVDFTDDGDGFSEEEMEAAFGGFRVGSYLNLPLGMGLHLSLAQELLRAQNGEMRVLSSEPGGTTVRISLPAVMAD